MASVECLSERARVCSCPLDPAGLCARIPSILPPRTPPYFLPFDLSGFLLFDDHKDRDRIRRNNELFIQETQKSLSRILLFFGRGKNLKIKDSPLLMPEYVRRKLKNAVFWRILGFFFLIFLRACMHDDEPRKSQRIFCRPSSSQHSTQSTVTGHLNSWIFRQLGFPF